MSQHCSNTDSYVQNHYLDLARLDTVNRSYEQALFRTISISAVSIISNIELDYMRETRSKVLLKSLYPCHIELL